MQRLDAPMPMDPVGEAGWVGLSSGEAGDRDLVQQEEGCRLLPAGLSISRLLGLS
jgi:hypothetical protein